jgi:serine/threonine-protein kinase
VLCGFIYYTEGKGGEMSGQFVLHSDVAVLDRQSGLIWQRGGSEERMVWKEGFDYIEKLNRNCYGGYNDWRYPNQEELAVLIASEEYRKTGLFIHSLFGDQRCCWTCTEVDHHRACYVDFYYGDVYLVEKSYANHFVRAVRSMETMDMGVKD